MALGEKTCGLGAWSMENSGARYTNPPAWLSPERSTVALPDAGQPQLCGARAGLVGPSWAIGDHPGL